MKEIDRLYMERPTSGSRTIKSLLRMRGIRIARSRVVRLMRLMGLRAIYPKRRTSSPGEGHKIYPYLLKSMKVTRPREVYAADITYIPMAKGFLYLVAVIDWHSLKQEEVYRRAYETVAEARKGIADYLSYFNEERPHQGIDNRTPDDVFYK